MRGGRICTRSPLAFCMQLRSPLVASEDSTVEQDDVIGQPGPRVGLSRENESFVWGIRRPENPGFSLERNSKQVGVKDYAGSTSPIELEGTF